MITISPIYQKKLLWSKYEPDYKTKPEHERQGRLRSSKSARMKDLNMVITSRIKVTKLINKGKINCHASSNTHKLGTR